MSCWVVSIAACGIYAKMYSLISADMGVNHCLFWVVCDDDAPALAMSIRDSDSRDKSQT